VDSKIQVAVLVTVGGVGEDSRYHPTIGTASKKRKEESSKSHR
jgi:hypothetical protein